MKVVLWFLFSLSSIAQAQTPAVAALIRGRVLDSLSRPISNAELALTGTSHRTVSSASGAFTLSGIGEGQYHLVVRRVGYEPVSFKANIRASDTLDADIVLARAATSLDSVSVTADRWLTEFEANRKLGLGKFFQTEEIEQHAGSVVHTLLRTKLTGFSYHERPCGGMALASTTTSAGKSLNGQPIVGKANGCKMPDLCYVQLFVDGIKMFATDHVTEPPNIDEYRLEQMGAIEVYSNAAATPARFASSGAVCGTVVLWRRR